MAAIMQCFCTFLLVGSLAIFCIGLNKESQSRNFMTQRNQFVGNHGNPGFTNNVPMVNQTETPSRLHWERDHSFVNQPMLDLNDHGVYWDGEFENVPGENFNRFEKVHECESGSFFDGTDCKKCMRSSWDQTLDLPKLVPFFMYGDSLGLDWNKLDCGNRLGPVENFNFKLANKHHDDYWFRYHLQKHSSRVTDPSQAKLFIVDSYNNTMIE